MKSPGMRMPQAGRWCRLAFRFCAILALVTPGPAAGQTSLVVQGRVRLARATDTVAVPDTRVVAHEVGKAHQGPVDSMRSGPGGRFQFRIRADTGSVVLLSASYAGIEYFSDPLPVRADGTRAVEGLDIVVSDTSSSAPVAIASRHVVIGRAEDDGTRPVLEIVALHNPGALTRVGAGPAGPTWAGPLPPGIVRFSVGEGAYSPDALVRRGDSIVLVAPVAPGEKQLLYSYGLPSGVSSARFPVGDGTKELTLLLEEFDRPISGGALALVDTQQVEGRSFQRWVGPGRPGETIEIRFGQARGTGGLALLVGAMTLLLVTAAMVALRRRPVAASGQGRDLVEEIARLDARYAGREQQVPPDEWRHYQEERTGLKTALEEQLARQRDPV